MNTREDPTYAASRRRFHVEAETAGAATIGNHCCPHLGPDGEEIFVDVVRLGALDASIVLLLISGTHGVEGYCGSMIQSDLLSSGSLGNLPDDTAVVLIHALNAFGFAWNRRVTEEGVDLNRNFVDFSRPPHSDPQFDVALANLLTPSPDTRVESDAELVLWAQRHGPAARAIIAGGQFAHPAAPFFGGHAPTWARTVLEAIVDSHVAKATRICVIDYHTGLGSTGTGQLIGTTGESMREVEDARAVWGTEYVPAGDAGSVSYDLHDDLIGAVRRRCASARVLAAAHEFGTVDEMTVLAALRSDHGAWRHGDSGGTCDARAAMLKAFFLTNSDWSASVKAASRKSAQQAIGWLATKGLD